MYKCSAIFGTALIVPAYSFRQYCLLALVQYRGDRRGSTAAAAANPYCRLPANLPMFAYGLRTARCRSVLSRKLNLYYLPIDRSTIDLSNVPDLVHFDFIGPRPYILTCVRFDLGSLRFALYRKLLELTKLNFLPIVWPYTIS